MHRALLCAAQQAAELAKELALGPDENVFDHVRSVEIPRESAREH